MGPFVPIPTLQGSSSTKWPIVLKTLWCCCAERSGQCILLSNSFPNQSPGTYQHRTNSQHISNFKPNRTEHRTRCTSLHQHHLYTERLTCLHLQRLEQLTDFRDFASVLTEFRLCGVPSQLSLSLHATEAPSIPLQISCSFSSMSS